MCEGGGRGRGRVCVLDLRSLELEGKALVGTLSNEEWVLLQSALPRVKDTHDARASLK
jgi:hypothetical protein